MTAAQKPDFRFEKFLWEGGFQRVAGVDEAGRGAVAGPVAVGVVIFPPHTRPHTLTGVDDSKRLTPASRERYAQIIKQFALAWAVGYAVTAEVDSLGIVAAVRLALHRAVEALGVMPDYLLLDYFLAPECELPQTALTKGDQRSLSIAAASILAKVHRDALMRGYALRYPGYGFARHKGYGTAEHRKAIAHLGYSPLHRRSFDF